MLIPSVSPVSAYAPNAVVARREKRSPGHSPSLTDASEADGASEPEPDETETGDALQSLARALHDAQAEQGPCDDSAPQPEDAHDPQELCGYIEP